MNAFIAGTTNDYLGPDSQIELTAAGEGDLGWGISVLYAGDGTKTAGIDKTANVLGTRLGIISGDLQVFSTIGLLSNAKNNPTNGNTDELKGKISIDAAATYRHNELTWFGKFAT